MFYALRAPTHLVWNKDGHMTCIESCSYHHHRNQSGTKTTV